MKLKKIRSGLWLNPDLIMGLHKSDISGYWILEYAGQQRNIIGTDGELIEAYLDKLVGNKK